MRDFERLCGRCAEEVNMSTCAPYARSSSCDVPHRLKSLVLSSSIDSMGLIFILDQPSKDGQKFLQEPLAVRALRAAV